MTQEFHSLTAFAVKLLTLEVAVQRELHVGLKHAAQLVEHTAKEEIGHYQPAVGPFDAWPELADETKAQRERMGFSPNDPLLRTGELRDSISHQVHGLEAAVGSTSDIALYQELGTSRGIPPRPFLGPALIRNEHQIMKILGHAVVRGIAGGHALAQLGYEERKV